MFVIELVCIARHRALISLVWACWAGVWRKLWVLAFRTWNSDTEIWFFDIRLWENFKTIWQKGHPLTLFNILIASSNFCPTQYYPDEWIFDRNEIYLRGRYTTCFVYWFHINWRISFKSQFSDVNLVNKIASDCIYLMDFQMHFKWSFTSRIFIWIC